MSQDQFLEIGTVLTLPENLRNPLSLKVKRFFDIHPFLSLPLSDI